VCGIVGIFHRHSQEVVSKELLVRMNETQFHRGPDEGGVHTEAGIGLAHRRLSIIDLSAGYQPLFNEDGTVAVVYNGEIYNFVELGKELQKAGHEFRTRCDTEVIVHAWEQWGEACVERFRGMFAFALWDRAKRTLFLARDRLGIKPLYYATLPDGNFIFSSELKALLAYPELPREIEIPAVEEYFTYGYVPEPRTILRHVNKLHPGHSLTVRHGDQSVKVRRYWDVPFKPIYVNDEREVAQELIERLREAVNIRLVADVPLGAFLSGGVDSSSVVAMMAELSKEPVKTCSIAFGDPNFNESQYADIVAKRYLTDHYVDHVYSDDFDLVDRLAAIYDEPYADSSAIPTFRVCELARQHVTVALSGDGGDENLAGYRRYRWHMLEESVRSSLPQSIRGPLFSFLGRAYPKADWAPKIFRAKSTFQALAKDTIDAYLHSVSIIPETIRIKLFNRSFLNKLNGYRACEVFERYAKSAPTDDPLSLIQYLDMKTYLPGDILTKVDRASMAHALEVRVPILDHKLVEWISGLPSHMKYRKREGKYIFKQALKAYLPDDILYRPKMGFAVPLASWFRGPLRDRIRTTITGRVLSEVGIFDMEYLSKLVDEHQSGLRDHSPALWSLLMFDAFYRNVIESPKGEFQQFHSVAVIQI
jgi:asparagine synthase (glutamine-hydrolysing)